MIHNLKKSLALLALLLVSGRAHADNVLANPGFESDAAGESQNILGWTWFGQSWGNTFTETGATAHTGANFFKVFQGFVNAVNYNGIYQDYISGPGATYSANGWAYTSSGDALAGQNVAWIEVSFRDSLGNILSLYRSATVTTNSFANGSFPKNTWVNLAITNQLNPATLVTTNTTTNLVAPAGTYFVRYQVTFQGDAAGSGGSMYFDDLTLNCTGSSKYGNWNIVWNDEFNGTSLNPAVWTYDTGNGGSNPGWGNSELEYYTANNAVVSNGMLNIIAKQQSIGGFNYSSARVKSQGLASWKYGRIEWRAKLPQGTGMWPALWLLGNNISNIGWPKCGEIDVVENNGSVTGTVQASLHSGSDETGYYNFLPGSSVTGFHVYQFDWSTNAFLFYVDGHLYESQTNWTSAAAAYPFPFNQPFFIIMNLAVGGNYVGNPSISAINAGTTFPAMLQVDYLRVYNQTAALQMSVVQTNKTLRISWPTNIICHLQYKTNSATFGQATNWIDLAQTVPPYVVPLTNAAALYRLQSP